MHAMIDLETLGTGPSAAIVQIGAVMFNLETTEIYRDLGFNVYVRLGSYNNEVDNDTIAWWLQEEGAAELGRNLERTALPLSQALDMLSNWPDRFPGVHGWKDIEAVWSNPGSFDLAMLTDAYRRCWKRDPPWSHREHRCFRTLWNVLGYRPMAEIEGLRPHNALDDAAAQANQAQQVVRALREFRERHKAR